MEICCRPLTFKTTNSIYLKYQKFASCCKDNKIRKFEYVAKALFNNPYFAILKKTVKDENTALINVYHGTPVLSDT